jgi:DNA-binding response OmpR family regulator
MDHPCVVIVEPDVLVRHPLAEYLRECGYQVIEALNTSEARQLILDGRLPIDVVMANVGASTGEGFALATWIRQNRPAIGVVLSGNVEQAAEKAGDLCLDGPLLAKPYHHQQVLDEIRRLRAARDRAGGPPCG